MILSLLFAASSRFALVVGANDGGKDRPMLRYADSDARLMAGVLEDLGGVERPTLLLGATESSLRAALADMATRMKAVRGERVEFILYYSGHSDEEGLLLGGQRFGYQDLRAIMAAMPSDVRVAILDSCASGALLRLKGGQRRQAFLLDASATPRGHAFITSSSADEAAQESDRIGGSFFTHYFVSGLRGAADASGDKRVTLNEAYQFAFAETLARTERTQGGPQHASYDIQLAGSGDLVFTDVRSTRAGLVVDENVVGRLFVRDRDERLIVELYKPAGRAVELGLAGGAYKVTNETSTGVTIAKVSLSEGRRIMLSEEAFLPVERETTASRGGPAVSQTVEPSAQRDAPPATTRIAVASLVPRVATNRGDAHTLAYFSFQLLFGRVAEVRGLSVGPGINDAGASRGVQLAMTGNIAGESYGLQSSVFFNWTRQQMRGAQLAWIFNGLRGYGEGVQLSMVANYAEAFNGMQLSLVNVGGAVRGFQFGLVNVASELQGFQLGLVNIAKETSGAQLGLISHSGNVPVRLQLYWSDTNAINAAVRYGSRVLYGVFLAGLQPFNGAVRGSYGLGLGLHGAIDRFNIDFDVSEHHLLRGANALLRPAFFTQARLMVGVQVLDRLMPFVGATANVGYWGGAASQADEIFEGLSVFRAPQQAGAYNFRYWFGLVAGLQF